MMKNIKNKHTEHLGLALWAREMLSEFVRGDVLSISYATVHQQRRSSSLVYSCCEHISLNLIIWDNCCSVSLAFENPTEEIKKVPLPRRHSYKACFYRVNCSEIVRCMVITR